MDWVLVNLLYSGGSGHTSSVNGNDRSILCPVVTGSCFGFGKLLRALLVERYYA